MNKRKLIQLWRSVKAEPALVSGFVQAALVLCTSLGLNLSTEQVALINTAAAAVLAVAVAWGTKETLNSLIIGAFQALAACAIGLGLNLTTDQTASAIALVAGLLALVNRATATPVDSPVPADATQVVAVSPEPELLDGH